MKNEELTLVQLGSHLRIEESLRAQENDKPKGKDVVGSSSVNMVEDRRATKTNDKKGKMKVHDNKHDGSNKKPKLTCWKCGKSSHFKRDYRVGKGGNHFKNTTGASGSGEGSKDHIPSKDRGWFKVFQPVDDGLVLHIGNESNAPIAGVGSVVLEFTSGKTISLSNVLCVTKFRKNLVSGPMLNKCGFRQVFESDKYILSKSGVFVGFGYYNNEPNDLISVNIVIESRDTIFDETRFSSIPRSKEMIPSTSGTHRETESSEMTLDEPMELRKSKRKRKPKSFGPDFQLYLIEGSRDEVSTLYPYCFNVENDQKTFDEAMKSQDVAFWKEAINDEMDSIMVNNTWVLANLPPGYKPLGCKWIFKKKMKVDGTIEKFKARLVIQTFRQRPGIDYFDTYTPIARILTIRLLIDLASIHNLLIHQMDVKIVFLNGDLDEEVYLKQPEGFIMPGNEHKVLHKGYGGGADVILGIRIIRENKGISISQSHYIEKVLKKFNCFDCTPMSTPMDPSVKIMPNTLAKTYSQMYNGKSRHLGV
ncbi:UNVERIFIED_CONTAM: Retrovirus-related Pol polyprotein from transposon TNT 1-94 [Sesamum radiatum]|uniref:Retrovirus-related Pol polyprotein from transposon TNT 1-94 n=1 Tax=Sesamum radiatum TaxID=300843 RepID=A0AAW2KSV7_SESRA